MSLSPVSGNSQPIDTWRDHALDPALRAQGGPPANTPRSHVDTSAGFPRGDGSFAESVQGTAPQPERDLHLSLMANDSYTLAGPDGVTGTAAEAELQAAGWTRLVPSEDGSHLIDAQGNEIPISTDKLHDLQTGFDAAIYQNADGQYVVAYRGTDNWGLGQGGDSRANGGQGLGMETAQYSQAMELASLAVDTFGEGNVAITGHSLGGGLASAAMLATGVPGVTFNASGLSNNTLASLGFNPNGARSDLADSGQIRRYVVDGDPLTLAQQDLPVLPIVGLSPPDAVGHELRIDPPAGMGRFDLGGLHGGGADHPSYVEALRENTAGAPLDLSGTDLGLALSTVENIGEHGLNQLGALADGLGGLYRDGSETVSDTVKGIGEAIENDFGNGDYVGGTLSIAGDVVDGVVGLGGDVVANTLDTAGDAVENVANLGGSVLRDVGDRVGFDAPFDAVATGVEWTGRAVDDVADAAGNGVQWGLDKVGDGAEWVIDKTGDGAQWAADRVVDGARAVGEAAVWTGERLADGARAVGEAAAWTGDRVADGARWVAEKANPLNWFR
ncbi:Mbeg1-like protein [Luteimonas sp. FCS-9]|uniref:Mbeg1-like protein n=1 Tax=Luteimonas sp. FCS-9 TaxID=1547516 RepID=UPI00069A9FCB|nr:Mbeg1-like protein [Luteimonas sp. FCS-9]